MGDGENDLRRRLHEALDLLERRDAELGQQRDALEASSGRLAECVEQRRIFERRVAALEEDLERQRALMDEPLGIAELLARTARIARAQTLAWLRVQVSRLPEPVGDGLRRVVGLLRRSAG